jgi:hypothetical protein
MGVGVLGQEIKIPFARDEGDRGTTLITPMCGVSRALYRADPPGVTPSSPQVRVP